MLPVCTRVHPLNNLTQSAFLALWLRFVLNAELCHHILSRHQPHFTCMLLDGQWTDVQASIVVMLLACIVGTGALLTAGFGGRNAYHDLSTGNNIGFAPFCR